MDLSSCIYLHCQRNKYVNKYVNNYIWYIYSCPSMLYNIHPLLLFFITTACNTVKNNLVKFTIISITTVVVKPLLSDIH